MSVGVVEKVKTRVCGTIHPLGSRVVDADKYSVSWIEAVRFVFAGRHDDTDYGKIKFISDEIHNGVYRPDLQQV